MACGEAAFFFVFAPVTGAGAGIADATVLVTQKVLLVEDGIHRCVHRVGDESLVDAGHRLYEPVQFRYRRMVVPGDSRGRVLPDIDREGQAGLIGVAGVDVHLVESDSYCRSNTAE